jgi:hypothetical protein
VNAAGSAIATRPHRKAARLSATPTPFSSIARSIASAGIGSAAAWYAAPMRRKWLGVVEPKSASAAAKVSRSNTSRVDAPIRARRSSRAGNPAAYEPSTIGPVGTSVVETKAAVREGSAYASVRGSLPVRMSSAR